MAAQECYIAMLEMEDHQQTMCIGEQQTMAEPVEELEEVITKGPYYSFKFYGGTFGPCCVLTTKRLLPQSGRTQLGSNIQVHKVDGPHQGSKPIHKMDGPNQGHKHISPQSERTPPRVKTSP